MKTKFWKAIIFKTSVNLLLSGLMYLGYWGAMKQKDYYFANVVVIAIIFVNFLGSCVIMLSDVKETMTIDIIRKLKTYE